MHSAVAFYANLNALRITLPAVVSKIEYVFFLVAELCLNNIS
jgi:hypothetical protein